MPLYQKNDYPKALNRITSIYVFFILIALLCIIKLFYIQILHADLYKTYAQDQHWSSFEIPARRGTIYSSDGFPLASTATKYLMYAEPKKIKDKPSFVNKLFEIYKQNNINKTSEDYKTLIDLVSKDLFWVGLDNSLDSELKKKFEDANLANIGFEISYARFYPEGNFASNLLGIVAKDKDGNSLGSFGLEGYFEGELKGRSGRVLQEKDALGDPILFGGYKKLNSIPGRDLVLTLDRGAQHIVEKHLEDAVKAYSAKTGTVIVMDPKNGDILAMANYPELDFKNPLFEATETTGSVKNLGLSNIYEPGSVIKPLTVAAAIDLGIVNKHTTYVDSGQVKYSDYYIDNWDRKHHGEMNIIQLLQKSNNIGAAWVGHLVGAEKLVQYFKAFGLGKLYELDLEGEESGSLKPYDSLTAIDLANISFGQGMSATPLQVLNAFNVFANNGYLIKPRIVKTIIEDNKYIDIPVKNLGGVLKPSTADQMLELLTLAVDGGESKFFNIKNYYVAGKTGTAQIPFQGKYDANKTNVTFVGFLPTSKKFSLLVKFEEPKSSIYAAETAVPTWMLIAGDLAKYYNIPPDKPLIDSN